MNIFERWVFVIFLVVKYSNPLWRCVRCTRPSGWVRALFIVVKGKVIVSAAGSEVDKDKPQQDIKNVFSVNYSISGCLAVPYPTTTTSLSRNISCKLWCISVPLPPSRMYGYVKVLWRQFLSHCLSVDGDGWARYKWFIASVRSELSTATTATGNKMFSPSPFLPRTQ